MKTRKWQNEWQGGVIIKLNNTSGSGPSTLITRLIGGLKLVLITGIAYGFARIVIGFTAPESLWESPPSIQPSPVTRAASTRVVDLSFDPFHRNSETVADEIIEIGTDAPETTLNLKLFGRRAGKNGTAIVQTPDKKQALYKIGDEIIDGVILKAVTADYIVLSQGGRVERLTFEREAARTLSPIADEITRTATMSTSLPPTSLPPTSGAANALMDQIRIQPVYHNGVKRGIRLSPRSSKIDLSQYGLQPSDIITRINTVDMAAKRPDIFALRNERHITLTILRDGVQTTLSIGH